MSDKKLLCEVHPELFTPEALKRIEEIEDIVEENSLVYKYCRISNTKYSSIMWDKIRPIILFSLYHMELKLGKQIDYKKFKLDEYFENSYYNYITGNTSDNNNIETLIISTFEKYSV